MRKFYIFTEESKLAFSWSLKIAFPYIFFKCFFSSRNCRFSTLTTEKLMFLMSEFNSLPVTNFKRVHVRWNWIFNHANFESNMNNLDYFYNVSKIEVRTRGNCKNGGSNAYDIMLILKIILLLEHAQEYSFLITNWQSNCRHLMLKSNNYFPFSACFIVISCMSYIFLIKKKI